MLLLITSVSSAFTGFESSTLPPASADGWGLKIVVLNVGQAEA